jgi:hypothetical protein
MMRACLALSVALPFLLSLGCQRLPGDEDDDDDGPSTPDTTGGTFQPGDGTDEGVDGEDEEESEGSSSLCDPVDQTGCESGQKCTAILTSGEIVYACAPAPGGLGPEEACAASPTDGLDGCPAGYACLADEAEAGLCAPLCESNADCTQGLCVPARETDIPYCADDCSPFEGACPPPLQCRRSGDRFSCTFLSLGDVGGPGEPCQVTDDAGCAPGLVCLPGALVPGCSTDNCCTTVCDTSESDPCQAPASCQPVLEGPAPGYENIGACFVPA